MGRSETRIDEERSKRIARRSKTEREEEKRARERRSWLAVLCAPRKRCL